MLAMTLLLTFARDERGAAAIEYALVAGMIACFLIGSVQKVGNNVNGKIRAISNALS